MKYFLVSAPNKSINIMPSAPDAAKMDRLLRRYASIRKNPDHAKSLSKVVGCIEEDRICS